MHTKSQQTPALTTEWVSTFLSDHKAEDIVAIDIHAISDIADAIVVATGTSKRHVRALAEHLVATCKQHKLPIVSYEGQDNSEWVLVDLGDIVVHVMQAETRAHYQLEKLWNIQPESQPESQNEAAV